MKTRPTPETDAEFPSFRHRPDEIAVWVSIGRLRDLERKRDEAREQAAELLEALEELTSLGSLELPQQRDVALLKARDIIIKAKGGQL